MTLDLLAARWWQRWRLALGAVVAASAALGLALGHVAGWPAAGTAMATLILAIGAALFWWRVRPAVDARVVARHLNRHWPELEDSAELLVTPTEQLSIVERLQRERTERAFERITTTPHLPHRPWRVGLSYAGGALAVAVLLMLWPARTPAGAGPVVAGAPRTARALRVGDVAIDIVPPSYTGRPARQSRDWDVEVPAGSRLLWHVGVPPGAAGSLMTSNNDTLSLADATLEAERSALYFVTIVDSGGRRVSSDFHQLTVTPDAAPTITVLSPDPRTAIAPGRPSAVPLRVLVGDDYGVADTRIVATLTTGQGEGVKFREQTLDFERSTPRADRRPGSLLERTLDPRALGLGPGDELYFYVLARDNRQPQPQETRSETFFVTLVDTAQALTADFSGLAVNLVPEYFRSQRQIIIDTERLLAERRRITNEEFRARAENIGLDQHLLRLRYGEIVGDEVVEGEVDAGATHEHDIEDNATRLAPTVKATLQGALAQMWQAELRLRTSDPQGALPFEYRALELLKEVQQSARVYVRRVGFEPPPLEPDRKRLTGDLSTIGRPLVARDVAARDSLPGLRAALTVVHRLAAGGAPVAADVPPLERGGQELAALAVAAPGTHLETLRQLRDLIDALRRGTTCAACLASLDAELAGALPPPAPAAASAPVGSGVARTYFDLLRAP